MTILTITELEAAINWYREQEPSILPNGDPSYQLGRTASKLATSYALMIFHKHVDVVLEELGPTVISMLARVPAHVRARAQVN
jgi:hypothetical protein